MKKILVIEDEPEMCRNLASILRLEKFHPLPAENGRVGLKLAKKEKPDLVIMDVIMPGMNGFQATRTLSRDTETSNIPILIVTTKSMETDRVWGLRQGAKDFLTKPVTAQELLTRIQNLLPN